MGGRTEIDARWEQIYDNLPSSPSQSSAQREDYRDLFENQAGEEDKLKNHLTWQLDCSHLSEQDHDIGLAIIDSIDDSGYLTEGPTTRELEEQWRSLIGCEHAGCSTSPT